MTIGLTSRRPCRRAGTPGVGPFSPPSSCSVFLRNWRSTIIRHLLSPPHLVSTFGPHVGARLHLNILTLLALTRPSASSSTTPSWCWENITANGGKGPLRMGGGPAGHPRNRLPPARHHALPRGRLPPGSPSRAHRRAVNVLSRLSRHAPSHQVVAVVAFTSHAHDGEPAGCRSTRHAKHTTSKQSRLSSPPRRGYGASSVVDGAPWASSCSRAWPPRCARFWASRFFSMRRQDISCPN